MPFFDKLNELTKAIEDAEEERKLIRENILESVTDAIFVTNETGRIILINDASVHLTGYSTDELLGMGVEELVPMERRARHAEQRIAYEQQPVTKHLNQKRELLLLHKDGRQIPVTIGLNPVSGPRGKCTLAMVRPII